MIGHRVYPMHMHFSSREYDCSVTFVKVSDIRVPLQSRSFPSAGSPPGTGELPKRFLKLTTLYGTGQQEIGQFEISGSECDINQRRDYKFVSTDSVSVTKLHIYVDQVFNSGLTGHVTIDLKEFIGEDDSEIYLEYPLSASNSRHRTAKLQVVVQCKGAPEDDINDCLDLDMDLETFLYDEFPESFVKSSDKESYVEHLLHPGGSVNENNLDARDQQHGCRSLSHGRLDGFESKFGESNEEARGEQQGYGAQSQIPSLKDFEADFLGLDSILKDFDAECAETRPFLVDGDKRKKAKVRKHPNETDLHAAVFFAAGVSMQRHLQSLETNSQSTLLRTQESADRGISPTSWSPRVLVRSQSDEFDVKRILTSPERPLPEVGIVGHRAAPSGLKLSDGPLSASCSPSPGNSEIESAQGSTNKAEWQGRSYVQSHIDFVACPTCSMAESTITDSLPFHGDLSPVVYDGSTAMTSAVETQPLIPVSNAKPKRSAVVVVRNILGILFIAGVSFILGAHAGFLGAGCEMSTDGASKGSEIQQMGPRKEALISQMPNVNSGALEGHLHGRSPQDHPTSRPLLIANKFSLPGQIRQAHRKIPLSSPARMPTVEVFQAKKPEKLREVDVKGSYLNTVPARQGEQSDELSNG